jgi:hypothetical protein
MEIQSLYLQVQQTLPYKSPAAFGKNLAKNKVPLKAIGLEEIPTRSGREYVFHPTPEEAEHCSKLLCDLSTAVSKRPRGFFDLPSPLSDKGPTEKAAEKLAVEFFDDMSDFEGAA